MNDLLNYDCGFRRTPQFWHDLDKMFHTVFENYDMLEPEMFRERVFGEPQPECSVDDKNVSVVCAIPGCHAENIDIEINGNVLTIRVKRERSAIEKEDARFIRRERSCSDYAESIRLPAKTDSEQASAKYENGILTITVPREIKEKKVHVVSVQ